MKLSKDELNAKHVMLDLETMGSGADAAIIAIGAVLFFFAEKKVIDRFYQLIDLRSAVEMDGVIDPSTVMWWLEQSESARLEVAKGDNLHINAALQEFANWFYGIDVERVGDIRVWGNGSDFDNVILSSALKRSGYRQPWSFYRNRCYRTMKGLFAAVKIDQFRIGTHHNAVNDAESQALHLIHLLTHQD